jgi:hypothetical protein
MPSAFGADLGGVMRRLTLVAVAVLAALFSAAASAHEVKAPTKTQLQAPEHQAGGALNMEVVAHNAIGGRGYNADVWVHEGHAYVGSWGFSDWNDGGAQRFCPNDGVAVIDSRDPENSDWVATLVSPEGTSAEDVVVFTAEHGPLARRDIAVVGIQVCGGSRYDTGIFRGLQVFDVTDPAHPAELGLLNTGCCTAGLHELEVQHRDDLGRTFVYASVPTSEYPDDLSPSGRRDQAGRGDFRLIDVTNPGAPVEVSNWGVLHNPVAGLPAPGLGCDPDPIYGHSAEPSADGKLAFVSYWDSGFIALDLTNPAAPVFKGRTVYPQDADGDAHSSNFDEARGLLFAADEDFCKTSGSGTEKGFGYLRVYDYSDLAAPEQIGEYHTPNSLGSKDVGAGDYTIHNPLLVGTDVYISWYSDGVRVVDASNPAAPREVAYFVPPSTKNPVQPSQRGVLTNATQVWGVAHEESTGLVYASDMNSGLWILRRTD